MKLDTTSPDVLSVRVLLECPICKGFVSIGSGACLMCNGMGTVQDWVSFEYLYELIEKERKERGE